MISGYDSADGVAWEWLGTERIPLGREVFVGLAVTSHDHAQICAASFDHIRIAEPAPHAGAAPIIGIGDGLRAAYYEHKDWSGRVITRIDPTVDFDWGESAPAEGVAKNDFAVRWEGELQAQFTEPYALHVVCDDRARLWLDGELIIDEWYEHAESLSTAVVNLEAGRRYVLRLDYFENRGRASVRLLWSSPSTPQQVVPQSQLYTSINAADFAKIRRQYEEDLNPSPQSAQNPNLPAPWVNRDVGRVGRAGSATIADGLWSIAGAGADVWANADGFHFAYQRWTGDVEIVARVLSQQDTDPWAKAGLMLRDGLGASARHLMLAVTPRQGACLLRRSRAEDATALDSGGDFRAPGWLKLTRRGNVFTAWRSPDGANWEWVDTERMDLPETLFVGLAVNSHDNSVLGTVTFDGVTIGVPASAEQPARIIGSGDGLQATYFDSATGRTVSRLDPFVDFDWDTGAPAPGIGPNYFAARWEGFLEPQYTGLYALHVVSDDGARLWISDALVIDAWSDRAAAKSSARLLLEAGAKYPIKLEFYERNREAVMCLLWSSPWTPKEPIPTSQLYSAEPATGSPPTEAAAQPPGSSAELGTSAGIEARLDEAARDVLKDRVTGIVQVAEVPGSGAVATLGRWGAEGDSLFAIDRRGSVEYQLNTLAPDIYQLEIEGTSHNQHDWDRGFQLLVSVDGEYLGRKPLVAGFDVPGTVRMLTPWLKAGPHRLSLYWDNARKGRSFELTAVRLQQLPGPDANGNGVRDWAETWLKQHCGLENARGDSSLIRSVTSPMCLEGRGRFLSLMEITGPKGVKIEPYPAPNARWYAEVPLSPDEGTEMHLSYENGGYLENCTLIWEPVNLLTARDMAVRVGDALLFTCAPESGAASPATSGAAHIEVDGQLVHAGDASQSVAHRFERAGTFIVRGAFTDARGRNRSNTIRVTAVAVSLGQNVAAWVGRPRTWSGPALTLSEVVLEPDARLKLTPNAASTEDRPRFVLVADEAEPRYIVARLGQGGPILDAVRVDGFRLSSGTDTDFEIIDRYDDGTDLIEMGLVLSPVLPEVAVEIKLIVGGVVFEDGNGLKRWTAADFNPLGEAVVRFLRPALAKTSVCHTITAWQGPVRLDDGL